MTVDDVRATYDTVAASYVDQVYGHEVSATSYRFRPERLTDLLDDAGFEPVAKVVREPHGGERSKNAYLLARRR